MPAIWLSPEQSIDYVRFATLGAAAGWREAQSALFYPSEALHREIVFTAADGTRVIMHDGSRAEPGLPIAIVGDAPDAIAARIAKEFRIRERRDESQFHRYRPEHIAGCAGHDGVWVIDSAHGRLVWCDASSDAVRVVAEGLPSAVAIAGDARALYVTCVDEPDHGRLARVDPLTGAVRWLHEQLVRPAQLATIGDIVYVACGDGLVAFDAAGNLERVELHGAPLPFLLGSSATGLVWIDKSGNNLVAYDRGRIELLATDRALTALDVDGDFAFALDGRGCVLECRRGRAPREHAFALGRSHGTAGLVRLGAFVAITVQYDGSWFPVWQIEHDRIGFPEMADAPAPLLAQLDTDDHAWDVLADWLAERGIPATAERLRAEDPSWWHRSYASRSGAIAASPLARPLVTVDHVVGYHLEAGGVTDFLG